LAANQRQRAPDIADAHESHICRITAHPAAARQDGACAGGDRRADEAQAIGLAAGNSHEQVAAFDGAAVRGHAADVEIGMA
jgi:hypothetical protein